MVSYSQGIHNILEKYMFIYNTQIVTRTKRKKNFIVLREKQGVKNKDF